MRFLPKEEYATLADPRFKKGEMKVVTYLEGRQPRDEDSDQTKDTKLAEATEKMRSNLGEMNPFREFSVNLTLGAVNNALVSGSAFVLALFAITF